ncbi:MAG: hypothetical protein K5669_10840 [Lachnospiraceae bacterium]|nr:hypothetical protein [Lachnospiraceae bacterium]
MRNPIFNKPIFKIIIITAFLALIVAFTIFIRHMVNQNQPESADSIEVIEDIAAIEKETLSDTLNLISTSEISYDTYFVSLYDKFVFDSEYIKVLMNWNTFVFSEDYPNLSDEFVFDEINSVILNFDYTERVFWGIDPLIIRITEGSDSSFDSFVKDHIVKEVSDHPEITFRILLPAHSIAYYSSLEKEDLSLLEGAYASFADALSPYENVEWDFPGNSSWIYENPGLYEGDFETIKQPDSDAIIGHILADDFKCNNDEISEKASSLMYTIDNYNYTPHNLSDLDIVIFGDSIFAYRQNDTAIHYILKNFTGADVICKAQSGAGACPYSDGNYSKNYFGGQLDDIAGLKKEVDEVHKDTDSLVFIIEFGINDYFRGIPVSSSDDPNSVSAFCGAVRTAVNNIRDIYPDSKILILSPGYINVMDKGTAKVTPDSSILDDYGNACTALSEELDLGLLCLTDLPGITPENFDSYLNDGVHFNEDGCIIVTKYLIEKLSEFE